MIICIETSEKVCSVALVDESGLKGSMESTGEKSHASMLTILIEKLLNENQVSFQQLDAVAISKGPGSYTGLRIGVSTAKGICYGLKKPLIAIGTLDIICARFIAKGTIRKSKKPGQDILLCPMIDARRMEVYTQLFNAEGMPVDTISAEIINSNSFCNELESKEIYFFGSGAEKTKTVINNDNAIFVENIIPHASNMAELALNAYRQNKFEDVAYFEPYYLKDFVATVPKKKVISF